MPTLVKGGENPQVQQEPIARGGENPQIQQEPMVRAEENPQMQQEQLAAEQERLHSFNNSDGEKVGSSIATPITGSGKSIDSNTIGADSSHNVSPVRISFKPTAAPISPAPITSTGFCLFECI